MLGLLRLQRRLRGEGFPHPVSVNAAHCPRGRIAALLKLLGKAFKSCVFVEDDATFAIAGEKKRLTPEQLWDAGIYRDTRGVVIGQKRIMRTRPMFPAGWTAKFKILLMPDAGVEAQSVSDALTAGGMFSGVGDFRPRFGRFGVESFA